MEASTKEVLIEEIASWAKPAISSD